MKVRLASGSPRRLELLQQVGLEVEICSSNFEEISSGEYSPAQIVAANASGKANSAAETVGTLLPLIAADTVVASEGKILGKPVDDQAAAMMLRQLSGKCHRVLTGVAVFFKEKHLIEVEETKVWFRNLSDSEIAAYIKTGEPFDKAGAYGIQGRGAILVEKIEGCYSNVVGLPLTRLYQMMEQIGVRGF